MTTWLLVMLGAAVGAPCRFALTQAAVRRSAELVPIATFAVNVTGSLLLGVVLRWALDADDPAGVVALVGTGFCGGLTTYSTFALEAMALADDHEPGRAGAYVVASVVVGVTACAAGWWLAGRM
ncbi:MAG: fluoride efflux transporter CrcB [Ilumatobacteraceae bacterium]|nr:fluoride efflux transporter CrcB [Ilumatobacteraceae bacterium]